MHSANTDMLGQKVFQTTKRPFYFYFTTLFWLILFFILVFKFREFDRDAIIDTVIVLVCFAIFFYILFGRYLANIALYENKIHINYLFPWNKGIEFRFDKLKEIEFKEFEFIDRLSYSWYHGGNWLYLKNDLDEICQFKYTINNSDNARLLKELQKRCRTNIH